MEAKLELGRPDVPKQVLEDRGDFIVRQPIGTES